MSRNIEIMQTIKFYGPGSFSMQSKNLSDPYDHTNAVKLKPVKKLRKTPNK